MLILKSLPGKINRIDTVYFAPPFNMAAFLKGKLLCRKRKQDSRGGILKSLVAAKRTQGSAPNAVPVWTVDTYACLHCNIEAQKRCTCILVVLDLLVEKVSTLFDTDETARAPEATLNGAGSNSGADFCNLSSRSKSGIPER